MQHSLNRSLKDFFANAKDPVLFAGAGISARAGLPTWADYLSALAAAAGRYDVGTANLMRERIKGRYYLNAGQLYLMCPLMPEGEKFQHLQSLLAKYDHTAIQSIGNLPFKAYVTTNYDFSLCDAYAASQKKAPLSYYREDRSLLGALFCPSFYIARIHGRAELPNTIMLSEQHYKELESDSVYQDFLVGLFTRHQILFVGFSFADPAIKHVLDTVRRKYGSLHQGRHLALLPNNVESDFVKELDRHNIATALYSSENDHKELWDSLANYSSAAPTQASDSHTEPFLLARRFLASCYARAKITDHIVPLRRVVIEGVISSELQRAGAKGIKKKELYDFVHKEFALDLEVAVELVDQATRSLCQERLCERRLLGNEDQFVWLAKENSSYQDAVDLLTQGIINRFVVREGGADTTQNQICISAFLRKLVALRGWDLGAAFATNHVPDAVDIKAIMKTVEEFKQLNNQHAIDGLARAAEELIRNPEPRESEVLAELGRVSFALELVMRAPRDTLFHTQTLPERLYLDTNVLMPALIAGHPFHDIYRDTIQRLREAALRTAKFTQIVVFADFLEEVIGHRRLAEEEMSHLSGDGRVALQQQAMFVGTHNMNVFVSAYANQLVKNPALKFSEFLARSAPFSTVPQLTDWLKRRGIDVMRQFELLKDEPEYSEILHILEVKYADDVAKRQKTAVLIRHDAVQLGALRRDIREGRRALLVSADRRLREKIADSRFSLLANAMISPLGLAQFIDLLIGGEQDARGLSSMMWVAKGSEGASQVRNYLINVALMKYKDAINKEIHEVVDEIAEDIEIAAKREGISLSPKEHVERQRALKLMGQFENKFFERVREVVDRRENQ